VIPYAAVGVESARSYTLTFATDAANYNYHFSTGGSDKYMILAVLQLKTGLFGTNDTLDLTINMPVNNVGMQDKSVFISADASAPKGPFRLNYQLSDDGSIADLFDNTNDVYAEAV